MLEKYQVRTILVAGALAVAGLSAYGLWTKHDGSSPPMRTASGAMRAPVALTDVQRQRLLADPRVKVYESQIVFQTQARRFFAEAGKLAPAQRVRQAETLRAQIEPREALGQLSAAEAMLMEVGLIKATVSDESEQVRLVAQVAARYRARSDQREREWAARPKPQFNAYKQREADIVRDVMAMKQIPGRLSRDEYLRQKLQQAREQLYIVHE